MLQNLELVVLKPNKIDVGEDFGGGFASVAYYYFLKLKRRKFNFCSYIKIRIVNEGRKREVSYQIVDKILFISFSYDFSNYLTLSNEKKLRFLYTMLHKILRDAFIKYSMDIEMLENIHRELEANNWKMQIEWVKKKVQKKYIVRLLMNMDTEAFTFICEILEGDKKDELFVFKSEPIMFVMHYLFGAFKIIEDKVRIGNKKRAIFEIDLAHKKIQILVSDKDKDLEMFKFTGLPLIGYNEDNW